MNCSKTAIGRIRNGLGIALLAAVTGCGAYGGGGYYGGTVVVPGPAVGFWGGYERGRAVNVYSHRGSVSRSVAHAGGAGGRRR